MNCKPYDLAVFVIAGPLLGRIVKLTTLDPFMGSGGPYWFYEGKRLHMLNGDEYVSFKDRALRPITPPPGSVTDSEVLALYAPRTVTPSAPCRHKTKERA